MFHKETRQTCEINCAKKVLNIPAFWYETLNEIKSKLEKVSCINTNQRIYLALV